MHLVRNRQTCGNTLSGRHVDHVAGLVFTQEAIDDDQPRIGRDGASAMRCTYAAHQPLKRAVCKHRAHIDVAHALMPCTAQATR